MTLFDKAHKAQMKKNGEALRERLQRDVADGPQKDAFGSIRHNFNVNLLNSLNKNKVK